MRPADDHPSSWSLTEAARHLHRREITVVEYVATLVARIDALDSSLMAWVTLDRERLMDQAGRRQHEIDRRARVDALPALCGIPIGVKDIFYTADLATTMGSLVFEDFVPPEDATAVKRVRERGGLVLGKTATTEFAFFEPAPTRNPWNPLHTPGGSSSGSAAAVAAGMCPAALGSQTAGSLLRPGAYCGIVSLKPTLGRISRYGIFPISATLDHAGMFTRNVTDAAVMLGALAGPDAADPESASVTVEDYGDAVRTFQRAPRIGIVTDWFVERADPETQAHFACTIERLAAAGATVEEVRLPGSFRRVHAAHAAIMQTEMTAVHADLCRKNPDRYSTRLREYVQTGYDLKAVDYYEAQTTRTRFIAELEPVLARYDVLLTPTTPTPAPAGLGSTGDPAFNIPWTFAGVPAITLPSGLSAAGLPFGIQLAAKKFAEVQLLRAARWCEVTIGFDRRPDI
jgi:Asp-tRNA(Asn)/Glu-tRNA(Gln) amidotransferase A subunit family amidase